MRAAHESGDAAKTKELRAKMGENMKPLMDLHKKYVDEVRALLTDEQKTKLDTALADAKQHRGARRGGGKPAGDKPAGD